MNKIFQALLENYGKEICNIVINYEQHLTDLEIEKIHTGKKTVNDFLPKLIKKVDTKKFFQVQNIFALEDNIESFTLDLEKKNHKLWGTVYKAHLELKTKKGYTQTYDSGFSKGCGYDKKSFVIANALNQCELLLKEIYTIKENNFEKSNQELFGLGNADEIIPFFSRGDLSFNVLQKIGYKQKCIKTTKNHDVYEFFK